MIKIVIKEKKNALPLRNWGASLNQGKKLGKLSGTAAKKSKVLAEKTYTNTINVLAKSKTSIKQKLPKKSIYKKYGYF